MMRFKNRKNKGKPQPDADKRGTENVPLTEEVEAYFRREVLPGAVRHHEA